MSTTIVDEMKTSSTLKINDVPLPGVSTRDPEYVEQEPHGFEQSSRCGSEEPSQHTDLSLSYATEEGNEETVITIIRAKDVSRTLRRLPAGFYSAVKHSNREWRTKDKRVSVDVDDVEWEEPIPLPSDVSATIYLEIYATFELQPTLGNGEQLQAFTMTVKQLLDHSVNDLPFTFSPEDDGITSPCPSISVVVKRRNCGNRDSIASRELRFYHSNGGLQRQIDDATNQGHAALSRYRKYGEKGDLERSVERFERALDICPLDHPCRAAAQSNLAISNLIYFWIDNIDISLDTALILYRGALASRPVDHPDRPSTLIQLAIVHLTRFERRKQEIDRTKAQDLLHEAMGLATAGTHENRVAIFLLEMRAAQSTSPLKADYQSSLAREFVSGSTMEDPYRLGTHLVMRFGQLGNLPDLQQAISLLETAVRSSCVLDHECFVMPMDLAAALLIRFLCLHNHGDLEQAILRYKEALDIIDDDHPTKPCLLDNLGGAYFTRFQHLGKLNDLDDAISMQRHAVDLTPDDHRHKHLHLSHFGDSLRARFHRLGELTDLESALSTHKDAVDRIPSDDPDKSAYANNLGRSFFARYRRLGDLGDLDRAISRYRESVDIIPCGHPLKPVHLRHLAYSYIIRFVHFSKLSDLEQAIARLGDAIDLTPDGHKPDLLYDLGDAYFSRFKLLGDPSDLEQAISRLKKAVDLTPDSNPGKHRHLDTLGHFLGARFKRLGELGDLELAISTQKAALDLTPEGHPEKPCYLNNLGNSLLTRFERSGDLRDLEEAISKCGVAVDLTPDGHPHRAGHLNGLGSSHRARFDRFGALGDLEQAISKQKVAVDLVSDDYPEKPTYLTNLGNSLRTRFERLGGLSDLEQAILRHKDAVDLTPDGHPEKSCRLNNLGLSFTARFDRLGELSDLEDAVSNHTDAVHIVSDVSFHQYGHLNNLSNSLIARFKRLGRLSDLEEAISRQKEAVDLVPEGHSDQSTCLNNLGNFFLARFERLGELDDLEQAILRQRTAVDLTPDSHPDKPNHLEGLSRALGALFRRQGEMSVLEEIIWQQKIAIDLTPDDHPNRPRYISNLGNSSLVRFERLGDSKDLEEAVSRQRSALSLTPGDHTRRPGHLNDLGNSLRARFEYLGELTDLEEAISLQTVAVDLTPEGHPDKPSRLECLAHTFRARFKSLGEPSDLEKTVSLYSRAACSSTGLPIVRFRASQEWVSSARILQHHTLLHAYSVAISLLPQLAWIGLSFTHRYEELVQGANVVREAAAAALDEGRPETAVEWLEQGRSIVWGELFQLRSSYEELSSAYPDHARRLRDLSAALEYASASRELAPTLSSEEAGSTKYRATKSMQQEADRHRALAIERDNLLKEIRGFPGFERFLLHKEFSQLRASAHSGPVVILNAADSRCDALIILACRENAYHVPLTNFTFARSAGLQNMLEDLLGHARDVANEERMGNPQLHRRLSWEILLATLWNGVVKPVLNAMGISTPGNLSRIFWCPTGPFVFLPIHAAGLYGTQYSEPGNKLFDFVVSSYIPTLTILTQLSRSDPTPDRGLHLLAVRQPPSDGQSPLPGVDSELRLIREVIRNSPSARVTLVESSVGTVEDVLDLLKEADWCHFACHGIQDAANPTDSGLCLADRCRLRLSDIITLSRPRGGLAFLSACQTAMGDGKLSDEAIHIAAGMLFAGYGGVVGTMWSISDKLAPRVARDVYEQLFEDGAGPDYRGAARALHDAIQRLQKDGKASFVQWLPFIHVGL